MYLVSIVMVACENARDSGSFVGVLHTFPWQCSAPGPMGAPGGPSPAGPSNGQQRPAAATPPEQTPTEAHSREAQRSAERTLAAAAAASMRRRA